MNWGRFIFITVLFLIVGFGMSLILPPPKGLGESTQPPQVEAAPKVNNIWVEESGYNYRIFRDEVSGARIFSSYHGGVVILPVESLPEK